MIQEESFELRYIIFIAQFIKFDFNFRKYSKDKKNKIRIDI